MTQNWSLIWAVLTVIVTGVTYTTLGSASRGRFSRNMPAHLEFFADLCKELSGFYKTKNAIKVGRELQLSELRLLPMGFSSPKLGFINVISGVDSISMSASIGIRSGSLLQESPADCRSSLKDGETWSTSVRMGMELFQAIVTRKKNCS